MNLLTVQLFQEDHNKLSLVMIYIYFSSRPALLDFVRGILVITLRYKWVSEYMSLGDQVRV